MLDIATRCRHKAARVSDGEAILALVTSSRVRKALVRAAEAGEPPLSAIAPEICAAYPAAASDLQVRQLVGLLVHSVMAEAGFVVASARRRVAGMAPFQYAATFARTPSEPAPTLVARWIDALDAGEAEEAYALLRTRLGR